MNSKSWSDFVVLHPYIKVTNLFYLVASVKEDPSTVGKRVYQDYDSCKKDILSTGWTKVPQRA